MSLSSLLPLRGITVRLSFTQEVSTGFFHHSEIKPFLRGLLENKDLFDKENGLWIEALNSGRTVYRRGDEYHFNLFCNKAGYPLFTTVLDQVRRLTNPSIKRIRSNDFFLENLKFIRFQDYFTQQPVKTYQELTCYDEKALNKETITSSSKSAY